MSRIVEDLELPCRPLTRAATVPPNLLGGDPSNSDSRDGISRGCKCGRIPWRRTGAMTHPSSARFRAVQRLPWRGPGTRWCHRPLCTVVGSSKLLQVTFDHRCAERFERRLGEVGHRLMAPFGRSRSRRYVERRVNMCQQSDGQQREEHHEPYDVRDHLICAIDRGCPALGHEQRAPRIPESSTSRSRVGRSGNTTLAEARRADQEKVPYRRYSVWS